MGAAGKPDVVIRGGHVLDGSGMPSFRADVAIVGDRIRKVGRIDEAGEIEIDAEGHAVTPGFIDGHTHMDAQVFWDEQGTSSCWHGVTTAVMGNCGFTLAPSRADARELVIRNLERAEDISPAALAAGIDWTWETFREFLDAVDGRRKAINYACYVGHSALRTWAMGDRAFTEAAGPDDLSAMVEELRDALDAGAIGFTTSRSGTHETSDDRPVASRVASWAEVRQLVEVMGELGVGVFEIAPDVAVTGAGSARPSVFDELRQLAVESRVPVTFGTSAAGGGSSVLELLDETAAAGGRMFGQTHSRGISILWSFLSRMPFDHLPVWRDLRAEPPPRQLALLRDPDVRRALVDEANHGDYGTGPGGYVLAPDYGSVQVLQHPLPPNPTVAAVASARGVGPVEAMIDLAIESDLTQLFGRPIGVPDDDELLTAMRHPRTVMTFSDAGAHVGQVADASIQTHLLGYWVRERQAFPLEEAVRMLTLVPASLWGFSDRGLLREGFVADINVFDPSTVGPRLPTVEHDLPAGARRYVQRSTGFRSTIVAGRPVLHDGEPTGELPGRLLRGSQVTTGSR